MIVRSLPYWRFNPSLARNPWFTFQLDLARLLVAILPPTCLWGASFPWRWRRLRTRTGSRTFGRSSLCANTVGAILGAIGVSLFLIVWMGTQQTHRLLIGLSAAGRSRRLRRSSGRSLRVRRPAPNPGIPRSGSWCCLAVGRAGVRGFAGLECSRIPWGLVAYGRHFSTRSGEGKNALRG